MTEKQMIACENCYHSQVRGDKYFCFLQQYWVSEDTKFEPDECECNYYKDKVYF